MPTVIPPAPYQSPNFRALVRETWGGNELVSGEGPWRSAASGWTVLAEFNPLAPTVPGYELLNVKRRSLPDVGTAAFRIVYGRMVGHNVTPAAIPSYKRYECRIQLKPRGSAESEWRTVFLGYVDYEEDAIYAGADEPTVTRTYYLVDTIARTMKWPMNRHGYDRNPDVEGGDIVVECYGNPGYNYNPSGDGPLLGNKSPNSYVPIGANLGVQVDAHVWQGAYSLGVADLSPHTWTDRSAMQHSLSATRPEGEPYFRFNTLGAGNYDISTALGVEPNESVWGFLSRVGNRRRGLGAITTYWTEQAGGSGWIEVGLTVCPNFEETISGDFPEYLWPWSIIGAQSADSIYSNANNSGDPLSWELEGDHRIIDNGTSISDAEMHQYDYLETIGEKIIVATTLSLQDCLDTDSAIANIYNFDKQVSLAPRWSEADRNEFESKSTELRVATRYDHIYQSFKLPVKWKFVVGDALTPGQKESIEYYCTDRGFDGVPDIEEEGKYGLSSPVTCEILSYLPMYQGYDYSAANPQRTDFSQEVGFPAHRPPQIYLRITDEEDEDRWVLPMGAFPDNIVNKFEIMASVGDFQPTLEIYPDVIYIKSQFFMDFGIRPFGEVDRDPGTDAIRDITRLAITVGLRMPHHVRFCDTTVEADHPNWPGCKDWRKARRKKTLYMPNFHLWFVNSNCIWDVDQSDQTEDGYLAKRNAGLSFLGSPATLRDDRERMIFYHKVAAAWYLAPRRRIKVKKAYCGLLPYTRVVGAGTAQDWDPQMNEYIKEVETNGGIIPVGTPVTYLDYNHQEMTTEWATDWYEIQPNV